MMRDCETILVSAIIIKHCLGLPEIPAYLLDVVNFLVRTFAWMLSAGGDIQVSDLRAWKRDSRVNDTSRSRLDDEASVTIVTFCKSQWDVSESREAVLAS
jgi:hypothetical protein